MRISKDAPILIVGAGIFGLSTAIHAALRSYTNITVFDHQPYEKSRYNFEEGCDAASAGKYIQSSANASKITNDDQMSTK
jgi:sarcosine oxidase / L-pipecolate oxidase